MNVKLVLDANAAGQRALILAGPRGSAKTSTVLAWSAELLAQGRKLDGVASPRVLRAGRTVGYRVRHLRTGEERVLCALEPPGLHVGRFFFRPAALAFANAILQRAAEEAAIIVVDEVGPLELQGRGFFPGLKACLTSPAFLVLTVRPHLVPPIAAWFGDKALILSLERGNPSSPV